jgi:plasmid maintenance system antidote protein VapI
MEIKDIIKKHLRKVVKEQEEKQSNYMFFGNLEQIKRQCELLLQLDQNEINEMLNNGHDWADDHVSSAKENIDQVFDFLMNETKKDDLNESEKEMYESMEIDESKNCPTDPGKWAASKAAAKAKFDVYPSAYANGWAAKNYKSKGGGWRKCK